MSPLSSLQRKTALFGAVLLVISFLTGGLLASAMTGTLPAEPHTVLAAHLNALLGCFWLCALAFTLPLVHFGEAGQRRLVWLTIVPAYANWAVTLLKAFLHVVGVGLNGEGSNDVVFGLLNVFVVIPSLAAASGWAWGLFKAPAATSSGS